jgi:hypothetical protein
LKSHNSPSITSSLTNTNAASAAGATSTSSATSTTGTTGTTGHYWVLPVGREGLLRPTLHSIFAYVGVMYSGLFGLSVELENHK